MKPAIFHPDALAELQAQVRYYEERSPGLGERFIAQVEAAIALAAAMPGVGSPYRRGTRRVFPKDFPYSIVYVEGENLIVLAVAPFSRQPFYWRNRM